MCIPANGLHKMLVDLAISLQCYVGLGNTSDRDDQPVIKCRQVNAVSGHLRSPSMLTIVKFCNQFIFVIAKIKDKVYENLRFIRKC
jgi:hypothetical protein